MVKAEELQKANGATKIGDVGKSPAGSHRDNLRLKSGKTVKIGRPEDAVNALDNDFGSWGLAAKLLFAGHLLWLMKEIFWILLIPYPAWAFGFLTVLAFVASIAVRATGGEVAKFYQEAPVELMISVIQLGWIIFNVVLMIVDFMYAYPDEVPGYAEDLVLLSDCKADDCEDSYETGVWISRIGFMVSFLTWVVFSIFLLYKYLTPPNRLSEGYALQTCLVQGGWLAFWMIKDFFWSFDDEDNDGLAGVTLAAWVIHFILLCIWLFTHSSPLIFIDGLDDDEMNQIQNSVGLVADRSAISYVTWSIASLIWFICEDFADGELALRYVAAILCIVSFLLYASAYWQVKAKSRANDLFINKLRDGSVASACVQVVGAAAKLQDS